MVPSHECRKANTTFFPVQLNTRVVLRRDDGFLHSLRDFCKSNAFSENLIRTKFILHKIFFQMSILPSSITSGMFFNLHSKMTLLDFQLIIIITVTIQVAVLNRFSWNSHGWWGSIHGWTLLFLETISLIEPLIWGKCASKTGFLVFIQPYEIFYKKNFKIVFGALFSIETVVFIFVVWCSVPWKMVTPSPKLFFVLFWKILVSFSKTLFFFRKNC